ncbi:MAG: hypothetical protein H6851_20275 [Geminicoccaceae bacterium]|nr:hypothetical protein [Geminicoccaceae bacterium]
MALPVPLQTEEAYRLLISANGSNCPSFRTKVPTFVEFNAQLRSNCAHDAALTTDEDPNRLSFLHAVRVIRRKLPQAIAIPPETPDRIP